MGWPEVCKNIIGQNLRDDLETLINLDTWNKLSKPMQKLMSD